MIHTEKIMEIVSKQGKKANYYKFLKICKISVEESGNINEEKYEEIRKLYNSRKGAGIITFKNGLEKFFNNKRPLGTW